VETVQKGEIWVRRDLVPHLLEELTNRTNRRAKAAPAPPNRRLARLTPREREIVYLVGGGHSNKEIANELNVGERTVKAHMTAIFRKVGVSDRLRLALFVAEHLREAR
jgi:DNA-binding NarL/FixJ family response regulator